jgi:hypothetical protein
MNILLVLIEVSIGYNRGIGNAELGGAELKKIIALITSFIIMVSVMPVYAEEAINLEMLKQRSVDASVDLLTIDSGILTLQDNLDKVMDASQKLHELHDLYKQYKFLYDSGAHLIPNPLTTPGLTQQQIDTYYAYWALQQTFLNFLGIITPSLTEEEIYKNFIYTADVVPIQMIGQINNLRIDRLRAEAAIRNGVGTLWWNSGLIKQQWGLLSEFERLLGQQYEVDTKRLELGQISELELSRKKIELEIAKKNKIRIEREIENMGYRLRSMAGYEFNDSFNPFILAPNISEMKLLSFDEYKILATRTRADAIRALQVVDTTRQEERMIRNYVSNPDSGIRREAKLKRLEAEESYQKLIQNLDYEIYAQYIKTVSAKEHYEAMQMKQHLSVLEHNRIKALYNQGYMSAIDFESAKLALTQASINFENSKFQYVLQYQQLNQLVNYGVGIGGTM